MRQAIAIACLVVGVFVEQYLWDETMMESPTELTVTDFEIAEEGLSVVLTNALEDARELVQYMTNQHNDRLASWQRANVEGPKHEAKRLQKKVTDSAEMQFRAMRVLGLLEATRDREAGQLA